MTLLVCNYKIQSYSSGGKLIDFTRFVLSMSITWGLSASRSTAKVSFSQQAKPALMNVRRGSPFQISWGFSNGSYTYVTLYWIGTNWGIGGEAELSIDLVHKSWELGRTNTRAMFKDSDSGSALKNLARTKGVNIDLTQSSLNNGKNKGPIAVNQPISKEIQKQAKDHIVVPGRDGNQLELIDFKNLKSKAQAYYIDTEKGFMDSINISYTAKMPTDKSFIELAGGGRAISAPNSGPSAGQNTEQDAKPALPEGNYALLSKSDTQQLSLSIVVAGESKYTYRASTKSKLKKGDYQITYKNHELRAEGFSIGFDTDSSASKVAASLKEFKIKLLKIDFDIVAAVSEEPTVTKIKDAVFILALEGNEVLASNNATAQFKGVASISKIFIAAYILKRNFAFQSQFGGFTIGQLMKQMLDDSSNEAANLLLQFATGNNTDPFAYVLNEFCKTQGYSSTEISGKFSQDTFSEKLSTATDVANCLKDIFRGTGTRYNSAKTWLAGSALNIPGEYATKVGITSKFSGAASVVKKGGKDYIVVVFSDTESNRNKLAKEAAAKYFS